MSTTSIVIEGLGDSSQQYAGDSGVLSTESETSAKKDTDIKEQRYQQELKSRGLLNTDYGFIKKMLAEQLLFGAAPLLAVLLQIAHPGVGKGVGLHSSFAERFVERSENTAMYMMTTIYGTEEEKKTMRRFVTRRHAKVNDKKTNNSYNALDPKLQLWVAATLFGTYIPIHEQVFGPMSQEDRETALQEFSVMGTSLQVPLEMWPRNWNEFWEYWNHVVENELEVTEPCLQVTYELFHAVKNVPWSLKPLVFLFSPLRQASAIEMLPVKLRNQLGLESTWTTRTIDAWTLYLAKTFRPYQPEWFGDFVANRMMDMVRQQMKERKIF